MRPLIYGETLPNFLYYFVIILLCRYVILLKYKMFALNQVWMYDILYSSQGGIKPEFYKRVEEFITVCVRIEQFTHEGIVTCSCRKYKCRRF